MIMIRNPIMVRAYNYLCPSIYIYKRNSEVQHVKKTGKLPVVNFAAGGVATPADAALCMQLGVDGVFVGSGSVAV